MAETIAEKAARLKATRDAAVTSATVDGISAAIDQGTAARQLREANRALAAEQALPDPRPIVAQIKLT